jgi:iron complex outermembrane receptor protein
LNALLTDSLQMDLTASWVDAKLTEDAPGLGLDGDRLPGSPKYNAALGLQYDFQWGSSPGWARGDLSWVGDYYSTLQEDPPRLGDYLEVDLSAGMHFDRWSLEFYVHNLTDEDALTWANPIWAPYPRGSVLRPRTIGARLAYAFRND